MITFILNNRLIKTDAPAGMSLLNYIRNEAGLKGTKSGCKEGDCGACTVLEGEIKDEKVSYRTIVSCLTPLGNVHGKHIVTIEGLNNNDLTPVQKEIIDNAGTQCGFCTPGFIISLTGYSLGNDAGAKPAAIASIAGNICRCTGYKSIEKAAINVAALLENKDKNREIEWLSEHKFVPEYFKTIPQRLKSIDRAKPANAEPDLIIGGGTDLMVQKANIVKISALDLKADKKALKQIKQTGNSLVLGASATVNDLINNGTMKQHFPKLKQWFKLVSSEQIRNTATLAGNFVNASPIGDMSIFFLALDAMLTLQNKSGKKRKVKLKDFFIDYKKTDLQRNEEIITVEFNLPETDTSFNFEKVSKRLHLDIASVNSAITVKTDGNIIHKALLSAGGIGPVPSLLMETSDFLTGKELNTDTLLAAETIIQKEISPISDIRGSVQYKRLLIRQLFFAHFMEMFPEIIKPKPLLTAV